MFVRYINMNLSDLRNVNFTLFRVLRGFRLGVESKAHVTMITGLGAWLAFPSEIFPHFCQLPPPFTK